MSGSALEADDEWYDNDTDEENADEEDEDEWYDDDEVDLNGVRPYLLTRGRTGGGRADVKVETMVVVQPASRHSIAGLFPESASILRASGSPIAVAELAATVQLPLGVVQVLVGDLVHDGLLLTSQPTIDLHRDVAFLERLISRVAAL